MPTWLLAWRRTNTRPKRRLWHSKWRLIDRLRPPNALNKSDRPLRSNKPSEALFTRHGQWQEQRRRVEARLRDVIAKIPVPVEESWSESD